MTFVRACLVGLFAAFAVTASVGEVGVAHAQDASKEVPKAQKPTSRTYPRGEFSGFGKEAVAGKATAKTKAPTTKLVNPGVNNLLADLGPTVTANMSNAWVDPPPRTCVDLLLLDNEGFCVEDSATIAFCFDGKLRDFDCASTGATNTCGYVSDVKSKVVVDCVPKPTVTAADEVWSNKDKGYQLIYPCSGAQEHEAICASGGERAYYCAGGTVWDYDCTIFVDKSGAKAGCGTVAGKTGCFFK